MLHEVGSCAGVTYTQNKADAAACEGGSNVPVRSPIECMKAALALDITYGGSHHLDDAQSGCLVYDGPYTQYYGMYWNTNRKGEAPSHHHSVCIVVGAKPNCDEGWCNSPDGKGGQDCWAGCFEEPYACIAGGAELTGAVVEVFGQLCKQYTCCNPEAAQHEAGIKTGRESSGWSYVLAVLVGIVVGIGVGAAVFKCRRRGSQNCDGQQTTAMELELPARISGAEHLEPKHSASCSDLDELDSNEQARLREVT